MDRQIRQRWQAVRSSRAYRQHCVGVLAGTACGSLATFPLLRETSHLGLIWLAIVIATLAWFTAFLVATPLLVGVLLSWESVLRRWPSLQNRPFRRKLLLLNVAMLTALATHTILALGAAFAEPDGFSLAYARFRFVADRELLVLQAIAATAWLTIPRMFRFAPTSRAR